MTTQPPSFSADVPLHALSNASAANTLANQTTGFSLSAIDVVENISREDFTEYYLNPKKPLVIKGMAKQWPAYHKWTLEYLRDVIGDCIVPLYDSGKADPAAPINAPSTQMRFSDYIQLVQTQPTDLRIFLFDPIKHAPQLLEDYRFPTDLMSGFLDAHPKMFFGGQGSKTFLHFDIDMAHIFHTHFGGRKRIILFDYQWKERLYQIPYATYALEDYDVENPDIARFPALNGVEGIECYLEHGDTLFMPSGWWHWMKYLDGAFSLSLRAWDASWAVKAHSVWNLGVQRTADSWMKKTFKTNYMQWKEKLAIKRAEAALQQGRPKV